MRLRTTAINIRVTENEKKRLEKSAGFCGLSLSEYLRKAGLGKEVRAVSPQSFYETYRLLTQLRDKQKTMSDAEIDRALGEAIRLFLQTYHELNGDQKASETPWQ